MKKPKKYKWQKNDGTSTMSRHLRSEHGLGPEGEEGATAADKLNYTGMLLTCPAQFIIADELPFSFAESPNYEYFNRVALQSQYRRVPRNTLKRHTQQAYYAYSGYLIEMFRIYDGRVSLTFDTWTSTYGEQFVYVTAHWIDDDWLQQQRIIFLMLWKKHIMASILNHITPTRWNSIYKLLHDAIAYRDVLTDMYNESRTSDGQFITNDHWSLAKIVHDVLETFDNTTHIFSYVCEPNIHMVILECIKIICTIKQTSLANPGPSVKWCAYFTEFPPIYVIAAILDPGVKLEVLTNLLTFYYQQLDVNFDVPYYVNKCKHILERLCEDYGDVIQPQPVGSSIMGASRFGILGLVLKKSRPDGS
ncbi:putative AC9 transposase, partial [Bienertia sinuspersici]